MKFFNSLFIFFVLFILANGSWIKRKGPNFTILERKQGYVLRRYEESTWAVTDVTSVNLNNNRFRAAKRLNMYMQRSNSENQKMERTVPLVTTFNTRSCSFCELTYQIKSYIPQDVVDSGTVPTPNDESITIVIYPQTDVFVRSFRRHKTDGEVWIKHAGRLHAALKKNGVTDDQIHTEFFHTVVYKYGPYKNHHRNEIWIEKK